MTTGHNAFFQLLREQHKGVQKILEELKETDSKSADKREQLFAKLKEEIKPHMKAEEKVFYPALKEKKESSEDAMESVEEHHVTELVLNELDKMSKQEEQWGPKLSVLKELVEHHVQEEEKKIFKNAREVLSEEEMQSILKRFQEEEKKIKSKIS